MTSEQLVSGFVAQLFKINGNVAIGARKVTPESIDSISTDKLLPRQPRTSTGIENAASEAVV